MNKTQVLKQHLIKMINGGIAALPADKVLEGIEFQFVNLKLEGFDKSIWDLMYHIAFASHDILEFSINPNYEYKKWPEDYWPKFNWPDESTLQKTKEEIIETQDKMNTLIKEEADLFKEFDHGNGQTLLREAMLLAYHNAYHLGQVMVLKKYFSPSF